METAQPDKLAAFESDRIGEGWKEAHARRTKAGLTANGKPRSMASDSAARIGPEDSTTDAT